MCPTFLTPRRLLVQPWLLDISFGPVDPQFVFVPFIAPTPDRLLNIEKMIHSKLNQAFIYIILHDLRRSVTFPYPSKLCSETCGSDEIRWGDDALSLLGSFLCLACFWWFFDWAAADGLLSWQKITNLSWNVTFDKDTRIISKWNLTSQSAAEQINH